ncbi:MAG: SDR family NAD(P)-dependent oxidoreductase [Pirellulaceae bacterium]
MSDPQGKVVAVTGAGRRRVGNVVARSLAKQGFAVALHYHTSAESAQQTAREIGDCGGQCELFQADVTQEQQVDRMFERLLDRFGRLDALVTTASIWQATPLEEVTAEHLVRNFQVNTLGTFLCARRAGLAMASQPQGGSIITIGDWAIERPYPQHSPYFVSKGAIPTLTRALAVELAQRNPNVRVNCIHPGPVLFPPETSDEEKQLMIQSTLVKIANCPESIGQAVLFLIENPFVTGTCLTVDGGRSIFANEQRGLRRPL